MPSLGPTELIILLCVVAPIVLAAIVLGVILLLRRK
jgi:hypothetical protein